jgi:anhydro-N-acetylmuramic acid kinase
MISTPKEYKVIGMMSGTSLDGMDIAYCTFLLKDQKWHYLIHHAETYPYDKHWKSLLGRISQESQKTIDEVDREFGLLVGDTIRQFITKYDVKADIIGSHGHTVFHDPSIGKTLQIGDGKSIAKITGIRVINDFRSQDLSLGGQGAPLVPIGDMLLFSDYDSCLNLGGFANVSFDESGTQIGYDIGPCNLILNPLSSRAGYDYDDKGSLARKGKLIPGLLKKLEALPYYSQRPPKSLGREWLDKNILPLLSDDEQVSDLLHTATEHVAIQISRNLHGRVLVTGGGAYNNYLIERISELSGSEIIIPDDLTIQFKEAVVFAFLALRRVRNEINILGSVTGATRDHSAGRLHYPS